MGIGYIPWHYLILFSSHTSPFNGIILDLGMKMTARRSESVAGRKESVWQEGKRLCGRKKRECVVGMEESVWREGECVWQEGKRQCGRKERG